MIQKNNKESLINILEYTISALLCYCDDLEILQEVVNILIGGTTDEKV